MIRRSGAALGLWASTFLPTCLQQSADSFPVAKQMGHIPVSCSLAQLAQLQRPRKIYIHINNTNPMLNEAGREYEQVRDAGWEIAEDGWQFEL
jgi:hypothetical protein